jgi:hypothetical protein
MPHAYTEISSMFLTNPWTRPQRIRTEQHNTDTLTRVRALRQVHTRYFSVEVVRNLSKLSFSVIVTVKKTFNSLFQQSYEII